MVVLDEAQRIKNCDSKTAHVVRALHRGRSWALTGTPIENHPDDLVNLFAFVDPGRIPAETPREEAAATDLPIAFSAAPRTSCNGHAAEDRSATPNSN